MKILIVCFTALAFLLPAKAFSQTGTLMKQATAEEVAKDFKDNADTAKKKYNPEPPKGGQGGTIVQFKFQRLTDVDGKSLTLKTDGKIKVVINAKGLDQDTSGKKLVSCTAKFKEFKNNTVYFDSSDVKLTQITGE